MQPTMKKNAPTQSETRDHHLIEVFKIGVGNLRQLLVKIEHYVDCQAVSVLILEALLPFRWE